MLYKNLLLLFSRDPFLDFNSWTLIFFSIGISSGNSSIMHEVGKWRQVSQGYFLYKTSKGFNFCLMLWTRNLARYFLPFLIQKKMSLFCSLLTWTRLMTQYVSDLRNKAAIWTIHLSGASTLFLICVMPMICNMFLFFGMMILFWIFKIS